MQSILTVTTAASSYDLTTLAIVKEELGISDNSQDSVLSRYISSASTAISQYCNRVFQVETVSEYFIPDRRGRFYKTGVSPLELTRWPITAITSVIEETTTLTAATDYYADDATGLLWRVNTDGFKALWLDAGITVAYTAGYATIPADIVDAAITMIVTRYQAKGRDATLRQETIPGVIERTWWIAKNDSTGNMPPKVTDILDNYRVPVA